MLCRETLVVLIATLALAAQEHRHTAPADIERLGSVSFPIVCKSSVQAKFQRGIALLHSFGYNPAQAQFRQIEDEDPACAMAYWGDAMTLYRQLWDRPSQEDLKRGYALIEKAKRIGGKTDRERGYLDAAAAFYVNEEKATYETRTAAYSQALEQLRERFPDDEEAAIFYALSLLASPQTNKDDFAYRKKAVYILNGVFSRRPDHPGVAHYLIHACDNPEMASQALASARRYARIAPASAHALHMPAHIFARLGLWEDDIQSNLASQSAAEKQHGAADRLHAMDFLEYAYLQLGDYDKAKAVETEALRVERHEFSKDMEDYFFYVQVHFPALYVLETEDWKAAYKLEIPANAAPDFEAVVDWAKAIAAGHLHDVNAASEAVANYDRALDAVRKSSYAHVAEQMATSRDEAQAWLAFAQRKSSEATELLSSVADKQDRSGKGEVEIPAREMLAGMLLEMNRPEDALKQYDLSLKTDPNRFRSLSGAAHAAELVRRPDRAKRYYQSLLKGRQQSHNSELEHARAYVNQGLQ